MSARLDQSAIERGIETIDFTCQSLNLYGAQRSIGVAGDECALLAGDAIELFSELSGVLESEPVRIDGIIDTHFEVYLAPVQIGDDGLAQLDQLGESGPQVIHCRLEMTSGGSCRDAGIQVVNLRFEPAGVRLRQIETVEGCIDLAVQLRDLSAYVFAVGEVVVLAARDDAIESGGQAEGVGQRDVFGSSSLLFGVVDQAGQIDSQLRFVAVRDVRALNHGCDRGDSRIEFGPRSDRVAKIPGKRPRLFDRLGEGTGAGQCDDDNRAGNIEGTRPTCFHHDLHPFELTNYMRRKRRANGRCLIHSRQRRQSTADGT